VEESNKALQVRNSLTPGLTKLALDSQDLTRLLDTELSSAFRGSTATMLEMLKGTKSLSAGFSELASRILDAITQALLMKAIVGPISGAIGAGIGSLTTFLGSADGNAFAGWRLVPYAAGGVVSRPTLFPMATGYGLMGEAGPEAVMPLRRLGNGRLGVESAGGGANVQINIINNHPSARVQQREESDGRGWA
jgi:lambda family phage tail tape measure protein